MKSFRNDIITQVKLIPEGKIFTFNNLEFVPSKRANVAVILSEMAKKNMIVRVEKGVYYRPKPSLLGLKFRPLEYQEKLDFLTKELNGYITGPYIFNQMQLTEQVAMVITIATPKPVRRFEKMKIRVECVKSYIENLQSINLYYLRLLDAIKSIKEVPGATSTEVYDRLIKFHFKKLQLKDLKAINELALSYPPRVRKIMMKVCQDLGFIEENIKLVNSINSNTYFKNECNIL